MTTTDAEIPAVALLILARLLQAGSKGAKPAKVHSDVGPLMGDRLSGSSLADRIDQTIADLAESGLIARTRKGKAENLALTETGQARTLEALGIVDLPPKTTWGQLVARYLAARALGLPTPEGPTAKAFGADAGFRASVLRARQGLPLDPFPTLTMATDALLWKLLGREAVGKFDLKSVKQYLLARALGEPERAVDEKTAIGRLIAIDLKPRNSKAPELRAAAVRRWVEESLDSATAGSPAEPTLEEFARRSLAAAGACRTGRFGDDKVFIAHLWESMRETSEFGRMDLEGFKQRLVEANRRRLLDLVRADLVEAMDPNDVRESETVDGIARFHFLRF